MDKIPATVTRMDIDKLPDGTLLIVKYTEGWKAGDSRLLGVSESDQDLGEYIEELTAQGWRVVEWETETGFCIIATRKELRCQEIKSRKK